MRVGTAQLEITPRPGAELSGFAARVQPSCGVLDPLFARALFLTSGDARLLWIHADLIGFTAEFVEAFRAWAGPALELAPSEVLLSATHTHSGPCTIRLEEAGRYDATYVEELTRRLQELAAKALEKVEPCQIATTAADLDLAVDRRHGGVTRPGRQAAATGFVRDDGTFAAVLACYPVHPVALGARNRLISGDIHGAAAHALSAQLPGHPIVLMGNGACGDLNPPRLDVPFAHVEAWGRRIAHSLAPGLLGASRQPGSLGVAQRAAALPLDVLSPGDVQQFAQRTLRDQDASAAWGPKFRRVVHTWENERLAEHVRATVAESRDLAVTAVRLGTTYFLGVGAEVFADFQDRLRAETGLDVHTIGYANGDVGYLPTRAAYAEGGYEVERAHLFYGGFRFRAGALEALLPHAAALLAETGAGAPAGPLHHERR